MNSIIERWRQTCRRESPDRTLIWNQRHLLHALHEFERFYSGHRPHQGIANARPLYALPAEVADPAWMRFPPSATLGSHRTAARGRADHASGYRRNPAEFA
jgi:hypothetical protein